MDLRNVSSLASKEASLEGDLKQIPKPIYKMLDIMQKASELGMKYLTILEQVIRIAASATENEVANLFDKKNSQVKEFYQFIKSIKIDNFQMLSTPAMRIHFMNSINPIRYFFSSSRQKLADKIIGPVADIPGGLQVGSLPISLPKYEMPPSTQTASAVTVVNLTDSLILNDPILSSSVTEIQITPPKPRRNAISNHSGQAALFKSGEKERSSVNESMENANLGVSDSSSPEQLANEGEQATIDKPAMPRRNAIRRNVSTALLFNTPAQTSVNEEEKMELQLTENREPKM